MTTPFYVTINNSDKSIGPIRLDSLIVVGRASEVGMSPGQIHPAGENQKLIVAESTETQIPREWFTIQTDSRQSLLVRNNHNKYELRIDHRLPIDCGKQCFFSNDITIVLSEDHSLLVRVIRESEDDDSEYCSLTDADRSSIKETQRNSDVSIETEIQAINPIAIADMLQITLGVVRDAAGSDGFYKAATEALIKIVQLDRAAILLRNGFSSGPIWGSENEGHPNFGWSVVANSVRNGVSSDSIRTPSQRLLRRTVDKKTTIYHNPQSRQKNDQNSSSLEINHSLARIQSATVSPILSAQGTEVIGVLYGDRSIGSSGPQNRYFTKEEASIVEILASAVAGGLARQEEERMRCSLADHFSPNVAVALARNPKLLQGKDTDISVLFCDIRGFSSISEQLSLQEITDWMSEVMSDLSQCVIDFDGVLVDYSGDEILAMWGAPNEQANHAELAIDTGKAMLNRIQNLRDRWAHLPIKFGAGIGVNTGHAHVGNIGSRQKVKYGPRGNTVNVGSRLQSATKQFEVAFIASSETIRHAKRFSDSRRLTQITVKGIETPIDVYEIVNEPQDPWKKLKDEYELALKEFEEKHFGDATRRLGQLLQKYPDDGPTKKLLSRAMQEMGTPSKDFTGVWKLLEK